MTDERLFSAATKHYRFLVVAYSEEQARAFVKAHLFLAKIDEEITSISELQVSFEEPSEHGVIFSRKFTRMHFCIEE